MKIKLTSDINILLFEKVGGLEKSHPNVSLRHLFGFEFGEGEQRATIITGVENPLVADWREASEMNEAEASTEELTETSEGTEEVTAEEITQEPQSES